MYTQTWAATTAKEKLSSGAYYVLVGVKTTPKDHTKGEAGEGRGARKGVVGVDGGSTGEVGLKTRKGILGVSAKAGQDASACFVSAFPPHPRLL